MKTIKNTLTLILISSFIACGGGGEKSSSDTKAKEESTDKKEIVTEEVAEEIEKEVIEITLSATGEAMNEIAYEPKSLSVPANSRVKLTFNNKSSAEGMLHNFVLVELGSGQEIASAGIKAGKENEFIPEDDRIFANTTMTQMGETVTIEFDAPAKGSYHYICTYPGHYPNMIGRFNVE
ncbi:MAG: plastocyanin/azurin family copper-binding protein [Vicingaceae bacterium]